MAKYSECMSEASEPKKKGSAKMMMFKAMVGKRKKKGSKYASALA
jgi:hypothetical protein